MKSLMSLVGAILNDIEDRCEVSTLRDLKTITQRVDDEGISFLTISLANYGKDFQKSLDLQFVDPSLFKGFLKRGALPQLFGGLLGLIFDKVSGVLLDDPNIDAISGIHQITSMFSKIRIECSVGRTHKAFESYVKSDADIREWDKDFTGELRNEFSRTSAILFASVFNEMSRLIVNSELKPKHGPGATAERLSSNKKYTAMHWTSRLEGVFPHIEWIYPNYLSALEEPFGDVDIREPGAETPVRVISVPKTLKTPRIIAIEPTCMQYMQQAIWLAFLPLLERDRMVSPMIGFSDQLPNREMAKKGSRDGSLATLDLSEASDRVSNQHVLELFRPWRPLSEAVQATRSRKADIPGFGVKRLARFASMGSALCFPVESMVFLTVVFMGIARELNKPVTAELINEYRDSVRVYGDDIIVPVHFAESVASTLHLLGYKVNANKSFWTGKFRESCGGDYYDGQWITPIRVRRVLPQQRQQSDEVVSTVSLRNQLYKAGYWKTVRLLDNLLEEILGGVYPAVSETSNAVGKHTFLPLEGERMCPSLHRPMVKAYVKKDKPRPDRLEGYGALMKFFLKSGDMPISEGHLITAGRPLTSRIVKGWAYQH